MIQPKNPDHARQCLLLSGPTNDAAKAFLDGYEGIDRSGFIKNDLERSFYDIYWLKGNQYRGEEKSK